VIFFQDINSDWSNYKVDSKGFVYIDGDAELNNCASARNSLTAETLVTHCWTGFVLKAYATVYYFSHIKTALRHLKPGTRNLGSY